MHKLILLGAIATGLLVLNGQAKKSATVTPHLTVQRVPGAAAAGGCGCGR